MYTISKTFLFSASHSLSGLPGNHPCRHLHGHNYVVIVEIQAETLDGPGFVVDYRALDPVKMYFDNVCDHKHLNDVFDFNPTAENLAKHFFERLSDLCPTLRSDIRLKSITVKETDKTAARYESSDN